MSRATIKKGSKGGDVKFCQERLIHHGFSVGKWGADGDFGNGTHDAVRQFQASRNLSVDGIVGKSTWKHLEGASSSKQEDIGDGGAVTSAQEALRAKIPAGIGQARTNALNHAIEFLGADEVPDGSNWGDEIRPVVEGYNEFWGVSTKQYGRMAWCAMFCSSVIGFGYGAGTLSKNMDWAKTPMKKFFGGASQYEEWGKKEGVWVEETQVAPPGAVFSMARGGSNSDPAQTAKAGHVGMIVCDNGNGTVLTIEGNVSNGCRSYTRKKADLHGFIEWWRA
jgi:hypothetical protein